MCLFNYFIVRSNFLGTTFVIYSHGKNPSKREMTGKKKDLPIREELGAVLYVSKHHFVAWMALTFLARIPISLGLKGLER